MALLGVHDAIVRDALAAADGREVKHTGDGIMASFVSAAAAIRCATQIQRALAKHQQEHTEHSLKIRIGAAAGEPVERESTISSERRCNWPHGCVPSRSPSRFWSRTWLPSCVSEKVYRSRISLGDVSVRGFNRPIRVHAVEWSGTM